MSTKKPTTDELISALDVLERAGMRNTRAYDDIVRKLPKNKQPAPYTTMEAHLVLVGVEDIYDVEDSAFEKITNAIKDAWVPVQVKAGNKTYTVEFSALDG